MTETDGLNFDPPQDWHAVWQSPPDQCSYLPQQTSSLVYRQILTATAAEYEALLERGWRRHGVCFFRPACPTCTQCRSLRVRVSGFRPSKSQRRCWRRNRGVEVTLARPGISQQHLGLFNRYHADMQQRRGWPFRETDAEEYAATFLLGDFDFAYELRFFSEEQLVGVGLFDILPHACSSVYFYHDPKWRQAGPGVYSLLAELQVTAKLGRQHHYLGYWIADCVSMAYKSRYRPHELLRDYVDDHQPPQWEVATDGEAGPL